MPFIRETIGTYILVLVGPAAVAAKFPIYFVGIAFVLALLIPASLFPDGQFNPALTIAKIFRKEVEPGDGTVRIAGQFVGGLLASLTLASHFGATNVGASTPGVGVSYWLIFVFEAAGTAAFATLVLLGHGPFATSPTLGGLVGLLGDTTGGAFNAIRWFAPAVVSGIFTWELFGIYAGASIVGAFIAHLLVNYGIAWKEEPVTT